MHFTTTFDKLLVLSPFSTNSSKRNLPALPVCVIFISLRPLFLDLGGISRAEIFWTTGDRRNLEHFKSFEQNGVGQEDRRQDISRWELIKISPWC